MKKPGYRNSKKLVPVVQLIRYHSLNRHPKLAKIYQGIIILFKEWKMPSPWKLKSLRRMVVGKNETLKLSGKIRIARGGRRWHWKLNFQFSMKLKGNQILETGAGQSVKDCGSCESWGSRKIWHSLSCTFLPSLHPLPSEGMLESNFTLQMLSLNFEGHSAHLCLLKSHGTLRLR